MGTIIEEEREAGKWVPNVYYSLHSTDMSNFAVIVLSIVQGLTEFLPEKISPMNLQPL